MNILTSLAVPTLVVLLSREFWIRKRQTTFESMKYSDHKYFKDIRFDARYIPSIAKSPPVDITVDYNSHSLLLRISTSNG